MSVREFILIALIALFFIIWIGAVVVSIRKGWSKVIGIGGGFIAACLVAVTTSFTALTSTEVKAAPNPPLTKKTFGISPKELRARLNTSLKTLGSTLRVESCAIQKGDELHSLQCPVTGSDNAEIAVGGTVNPDDNSLRELLSIMTVNNNLGGLEIMSIMIAMVEAADSPKTRSTSGKWLTALVQEASKSEERTASRTINGREYRISFPQGLGIWFVVSRPD